MEGVYDVIIVGGGSMGMAAGYHTAKQGLHTLIIDKHDPPHHEGSHHGSTRVIRHAYGEGSEYVPLVLRAQKLWEQLQEESGITVFEQTGVLGLGAQDSSFVNETVKSSEEYGLDLELLSAQEMMDRWSGLMIPEHFIGCFERESGVLYSEDAIRAYRSLAKKYGATLMNNTEVHNIDHKQAGPIKVTTSRDNYIGRKVIIAGGAAAQSLVPSVGLHIHPIRKTFAWYKGEEALYNQEVFPAFFVVQEDSIHYGMPSIDGQGVKIGRHDGGQPIQEKADLIPFGSYQQDEEELNDLVDDYFTSLHTDSIEGRVCTYARTPDEDFIVDTHPQNHNVIIAAGFSGHGFKFSSVIGEILCDLAFKGEADFDLSMFSINRF